MSNLKLKGGMPPKGRPPEYDPFNEKLPEQIGVYRVKDQNGQVQYVGSWNNVARRISEHKRSGTIVEGDIVSLITFHGHIGQNRVGIFHGNIGQNRVGDPEQKTFEDFEQLAGSNNIRILNDNESYLVRLNFSRINPSISDLELFHQDVQEAIEKCIQIWKGKKWFLWLSLQENNLRSPTLLWIQELIRSGIIKENLRFIDLSSNSLNKDDLAIIKEIMNHNQKLHVALSMNPTGPIARIFGDDLMKRIGDRSW